ncbi:hypothetical protein SCHPADRAFT_181410 [Schizopora paradoxa]|uniref:Uncharacterized protein n=1 Tax=Schizopora paradoxa TaxID=27342 RepID=A0A0H2SJ55_9AGAM|nr:hypothetical protein SCHPADRAFT_181410 [Schizopora paradoxa]
MGGDAHAQSSSTTTSDHASDDTTKGQPSDDAGEEKKRVVLEMVPYEAVDVSTISPDEIPRIIKGARKGVPEDLKLILALLEHGNLPSKHSDEAFEVFASHVKKPYVRKAPLHRKHVQFQLVGRSLMGFNYLGKVHYMNHDNAVKLAKLWEDAFRWMKILLGVYLDGTYQASHGNEVVSASGHAFIAFRNANLNMLKHIFHDPEVFKLAFRLWVDDTFADEGNMNSGSLPLSIMCSEMKMDIDNAPLLAAAAEVYEELGYDDGEKGGMVTIAVRRLVEELQGGEFRIGALCYLIEVLWLFAKDDDHYGNKKALFELDLGVAAVAYAFFKLANEKSLWINRMDSTTRAIHLLEKSLCYNKASATLTIRMAQLFKHFILSAMENFKRHIQWLDDKEPLFNILDRLLDFLSVPAVLDAAYEKMSDVPSGVQPDGMCDPTALHGLTSRLKMIHKVILERTIMRKLYKEVGREELGFCANFVSSCRSESVFQKVRELSLCVILFASMPVCFLG